MKKARIIAAQIGNDPKLMYHGESSDLFRLMLSVFFCLLYNSDMSKVNIDFLRDTAVIVFQLFVNLDARYKRV